MSISEKRRIELETMRRQQILTVALGLFYRKGFANTTVADIANAANISKGLVYRYFDSKADILLAYKDALDSCFAELDAMSPKEAIREAARRFLVEPDSESVMHPLRVYILVFIKGELNDERFYEALPHDLGHDFYGEKFAQGIALGQFKEGNPYDYGDFFWHYLMGCIVDKLITREEEDSDSALKRIDRVLARFEAETA